ncbi:MAG: energy-coupling factor transporter ATPase [Clostridia bacterium]|nr:energy-coupling factor transporter ATPase [Clostridia bacterium]
MPEIIKTESLCFSYDEEEGAQLVLSDIGLSVEAGDFVAVLGHNGSGKSTLAKHFNVILLPTSGAVYVDGMNTADAERLFAIRGTAGMVFQNPDNQIVATVVEEDVAFACENMGVPQAEIRARVDAALEAVGMTEYARHAPHLLSGGQKQRVAIAGVLAMEPKILVMDEPTAMLDPSGRAEVMNAVKKLNREKGLTVVLITHHMDEAAQARRVVVMERGKVVMDGTPEDVFSQVERVRELSLAVPQTVELEYALNAHGANLSLRDLSVEDCAREIMKYLGAD